MAVNTTIHTKLLHEDISAVHAQVYSYVIRECEYINPTYVSTYVMKRLLHRRVEIYRAETAALCTKWDSLTGEHLTSNYVN